MTPRQYLLVAVIGVLLPLLLVWLSPFIDAEDWDAMTPNQQRRERRVMLIGGIGVELGCLCLIALMEWLNG